MSQELRDKIESAKIIYKNFHSNIERVPDTPYTTFYHSDLWWKNIMTKKGAVSNIYFKFEIFFGEIHNFFFISITGDDVNAPIQVKLIDFQSYFYGSFALDLIQFVFFNCRVDDLNTDFKVFINHYLLEFVKMLRLFNCPLDDYTNEK